jgi:hypothetical protein
MKRAITPIFPITEVSRDWSDLGAALGFIPLRDRLAVVVAEDPPMEGEDVSVRIRRLWAALIARGISRATVCVVSSGMDRSTSNRVAKARAYVVRVPEGFAALPTAERLGVLQSLFRRSEPVASEESETPARGLARGNGTKRYLMRNPRLSPDDVARWRGRYAS